MYFSCIYIENASGYENTNSNNVEAFEIYFKLSI